MYNYWKIKVDTAFQWLIWHQSQRAIKYIFCLAYNLCSNPYFHWNQSVSSQLYPGFESFTLFPIMFSTETQELIIKVKIMINDSTEEHKIIILYNIYRLVTHFNQTSMIKKRNISCYFNIKSNISMRVKRISQFLSMNKFIIWTGTQKKKSKNLYELLK